jgi:hypothetical protein
LGVNEYEGRAYLGLLERGPMTAYELGRHTGVPLSRCYEVARALVRKGLALVQPGDAPRYRAADPAEVLARRRAERASELDALEAELTARAGAPPDAHDDPVWVLRGRAAIVARAATLAASAGVRLTVFAPADGLAELEGALDAARARGVLVRTIEHRRALVVERDGAELLLGELSPPDTCLATWNRQPGLVDWLCELIAARSPAHPPEAHAPPEPGPRWLDWETAKLRRLLATVPGLADPASD